MRSGGWFAHFRAHTLIMALLFTSAIGIAYALLPGEGERIAMLERDGKTREARDVLEAAYASGDRRQRILFQLQGLYEAAGELTGARRLLEELAALRPRDYTIQRQLGQFYRHVQDEPAYIRSLHTQIELRYTESACRELAGILRRRGEYAEEQAALAKCRQRGYRRPEEMVRLASLLAADGDLKEAAGLLKAVDDLRRLKTDRERIQLFHILLESDQPREAQRRGVRWVRASKDEALALTLIQALAAAQRQDLAIELARETSVPGDRVFLTVAELMVERSQTQAAQNLLRGWLEKAQTFDESVASRFIAAALDADAPDIAYTGATRLGIARLELEQATELVAALEAVGRENEAAAIRSELQLGPRILSKPATSKLLHRFAAKKPVARRSANLAAWRADLWKRMQKENRSAAAGQPVAAEKARTARNALKAVKRARSVSSVTRRFKPSKPKENPVLPTFPP